MATKHAVLSASSSERWLNCPPSARLCEAYEDKGSDYAAEGTDAHALAESRLKQALGIPTEDPVENLTWYNAEMEDCAQGYAAYVVELLETAKRTCSDPVVMIEQRVDFSRWVPGGFGTGDCICIAEGLLNIVDLKYGAGIEVSADHNSQMMLYALSGDLSVLGSKARCVKTRDYGERKLYAYETPTPYFGDIGEAVIAEDGLCYVSIDPVFAQCVSLEGYQVFLQSYGKDAVCIEERYSDHFVVSGTPGMSFGWEIKAKQIDYDQLRMTEERGQVDTSTANYGAEAASYLASITEGRITT